jgi:hypothetical protein
VADQPPAVGQDVTALMPAVGEDVTHLMAAPTPPGSAGTRFAEGAWTNLNPAGLVQAVRHPIDTLGALIQAQVEQVQQAKALYDDGRYSEAAGHLGAGLLPLVGPPAAKAGERIGRGDIAGGLGEATGLLASLQAPKVVGTVAGAATRGVTTAAAQALDKAGVVGAIAPDLVGLASPRAAHAMRIAQKVTQALSERDAAAPVAAVPAEPVAPVAPVVPAAAAAPAELVPPVASVPQLASPPAPAGLQPTPESAAMAAALPDQRALNEAALAARRAAYQASQAPPAADPVVPASGKMRLTLPEFKDFQRLISRGMSLPDAERVVKLARDLGADPPPVAATAFPKMTRGK